MALKLHGHPISHNARKVHWALLEMGVPFEYVTVDILAGAQKEPSFQALNPNAKVPVIVEGDLTMYESNAILLYLAERAGKLVPTDPVGRAHVMQWLSWQSSHLAAALLEPWLMKIMEQFGQPLDAAKHAALVEAAATPLGVLEGHLAGRAAVAGDALSVADIAIAESVGLASQAGISLEPYPSVRAWFEPLTRREAFSKTRPAS